MFDGLADPAVQKSELSVTVEAPPPGGSLSNKQRSFQHTLWNRLLFQLCDAVDSFITVIRH